MTNFLESIKCVLKDESVQAIRFNSTINPIVGEDIRDLKVGPLIGRLLAWNTIITDILNYEYNPETESRDCHDIYIWTEKYILFVHHCEFSTYIYKVLRNPRAF